MLLCSDADSMQVFSWKKMEDELKRQAPFLLQILMSATKTRRPRKNRPALICVCAAILLKFQYPKMSLIHKIISCYFICWTLLKKGHFIVYLLNKR